MHSGYSKEQARIAAEKIGELIAMEWQPIETAPRGDPGPDILVWTGWSMDVVRHAWDAEDGSPVFFNGDVAIEPTHWMPLPAPPSS
jgi:hypothetical protein